MKAAHTLDLQKKTWTLRQRKWRWTFQKVRTAKSKSRWIWHGTSRKKQHWNNLKSPVYWMISHNSIREKIRETLPKTKRKNSQSLAALGVFMVDGTGLEPVTPCTSTDIWNFLWYFSFVYGHFCSVSFAFQHFLNLSFPHIPRRSVAVCVVKILRQKGFRENDLYRKASNAGKLHICLYSYQNVRCC